jgi:hypothetical protein
VRCTFVFLFAYPYSSKLLTTIKKKNRFAFGKTVFNCFCRDGEITFGLSGLGDHE